MRSNLFTARTLFERNWRRQSVLCTKSRMANHLYRRGATRDPNDYYHAFVLEVTLRQCVVVDFRHTEPAKTSLVAVVGSPSLSQKCPPHFHFHHYSNYYHPSLCCCCHCSHNRPSHTKTQCNRAHATAVQSSIITFTTSTTTSTLLLPLLLLELTTTTIEVKEKQVIPPSLVLTD